MNAPIPVRGLIALSTTSVASYGWTEKAKKHKGLHYFQSHGLYDELLPFKKAKKLFEDFQAAGLRGTFEGFIGEHEIPLEVLSRLKGFLSDLK
jgi:predicted esterase